MNHDLVCEFFLCDEVWWVFNFDRPQTEAENEVDCVWV